MKVGNGQGKYHIQAEINMIPLIDVALVLLIIFMVISPILVESQMRVNLPKVTKAQNAEEAALKVEIAYDGSIGFKGGVYTKSNFKSAIQKYLPEGHQSSVLIQADKDVSFNDVVFVMDVAKQLDVQKLGVSVIPDISRP